MQYLLKILPFEIGSQVAKKLNQKLFSKVYYFLAKYSELNSIPESLQE